MDALRDVKKQYKRNHQLWDVEDDAIPVFGTIASQFNDPGTNTLYRAVVDTIDEKTGAKLNSTFSASDEMSEKIYIIPPKRTRYLSEIAESNRAYNDRVRVQQNVAQRLYGIRTTIETLHDSDAD